HLRFVKWCSFWSEYFYSLLWRQFACSTICIHPWNSCRFYELPNVKKGETTVLSLVLSGIITTTIFTAGNYIIRYIVEPEKLQGIIVCLMGSLSSASWNDVSWSCPWIIVGSFFLILLRWRLNVLSISDEEARALGLDVARLKIVLATVITASAP
ncbi:MAG TPA: iron chelate uptake ABC transporter family permease subunit, partial [Nitrospirae bacterium]|nr:iron chelate uptake ABC transporter family permease subunit [Nitrospirota bacterium]